MEYLKGSLLVASPHLPDPNFFRSVVLMVEHTAEGALGLILNRVSNTSLREVWEDVCETDCRSKENLFVGGPVDGPLMSIHTRTNLEGIEVVSGVFFSSDKSTLEALVAKPPRQYRIFSGYAGWGPGQLENELHVGGWLHCSADRNEIFSDHEGLWRRVTNAIGAEITDRALRIRNTPVDPQCN